MLDFTNLPLQDTAVALRSIGQQLLFDLLAGKERPFLAPLLPNDLVAFLAQNVNTRQYQYNFAQLFKKMPFSEEDWPTAVTEAILKAMYDEKPCGYIPVFMWPFIGKLSWEQLDVQLEVAYTIYQYLKRYYLFWPDFGKPPEIHINTFWALIALANANTPTQQTLDNQKAVRCLQNVAEAQIAVLGWAGFWDQWILWQAWCKWPSAFNSKNDNYRLFTQLPLFLKLGKQPNPQASRKNAIQVARHDWEGEMPLWFLHQHINWQLETKLTTK